MSNVIRINRINNQITGEVLNSEQLTTLTKLIENKLIIFQLQDNIVALVDEAQSKYDDISLILADAHGNIEYEIRGDIVFTSNGEMSDSLFRPAGLTNEQVDKLKMKLKILPVEVNGKESDKFVYIPTESFELDGFSIILS
ncbi:MAG: hypothetical protein FWG67_03955 [Defluviitaleaceae bacterium]|nr:hypothetical protein [Defluviitaleaceae bacterium]